MLKKRVYIVAVLLVLASFTVSAQECQDVQTDDLLIYTPNVDNIDKWFNAEDQGGWALTDQHVMGDATRQRSIHRFDDFDNDGKDELLLGEVTNGMVTKWWLYTQSLRHWETNPGAWDNFGSAPRSGQTVVPATGDFITGDFDGDGYADLVITETLGVPHGQSASLYFAKGNENGLVPPVEQVGTSFNQGDTLYSGNINNDEFDDIILYRKNGRTDEFYVILGGRSGAANNEEVLREPALIGSYPQHGTLYYAADITGDGKTDLVAYNLTRREGRIDFFAIATRQDGTLHTPFRVKSIPLEGRPTFDLADINGDGQADLLKRISNTDNPREPTSDFSYYPSNDGFFGDEITYGSIPSSIGIQFHLAQFDGTTCETFSLDREPAHPQYCNVEENSLVGDGSTNNACSDWAQTHDLNLIIRNTQLTQCLYVYRGVPIGQWGDDEFLRFGVPQNVNSLHFGKPWNEHCQDYAQTQAENPDWGSNLEGGRRVYYPKSLHEAKNCIDNQGEENFFGYDSACEVIEVAVDTDGDGIAEDQCDLVAGVAQFQGCPYGDFDHSGQVGLEDIWRATENHNLADMINSEHVNLFE